MVEDGGGEHEPLEQQHGCELDVEEHDHGGAREGRKEHLAEMEAYGRTRIEPLVEVVHDVEAPEEGDLVVGAVPPVDPEIEQQQVERDRPWGIERGRPPAEAPAVGQQGERHHHERRQQQVDREQSEIAQEPVDRGPAAVREREEKR